MTAPESMEEFAVAKTARLLDDVVAAIQATASLPDMETVHKMRVAIRRFQQALRLFAVYFRRKTLEEIKGELRELMDIAGELRNYDITLQLLADTDGDSKPSTLELEERRLRTQQKLAEKVIRHAKKDLSLRWRSKLGFVP